MKKFSLRIGIVILSILVFFILRIRYIIFFLPAKKGRYAIACPRCLHSSDNVKHKCYDYFEGYGCGEGIYSCHKCGFEYEEYAYGVGRTLEWAWPNWALEFSRKQNKILNQ